MGATAFTLFFFTNGWLLSWLPYQNRSFFWSKHYTHYTFSECGRGPQTTFFFHSYFRLGPFVDVIVSSGAELLDTMHMFDSHAAVISSWENKPNSNTLLVLIRSTGHIPSWEEDFRIYTHTHIQNVCVCVCVLRVFVLHQGDLKGPQFIRFSMLKQ